MFGAAVDYLARPYPVGPGVEDKDAVVRVSGNVHDGGARESRLDHLALAVASAMRVEEATTFDEVEFEREVQRYWFILQRLKNSLRAWVSVGSLSLSANWLSPGNDVGVSQSSIEVFLLVAISAAFSLKELSKVGVGLPFFELDGLSIEDKLP